MDCLNCGKETQNPKFCSRSCAATTNNKLTPKKTPQGKCEECSKTIMSAVRFCKEHSGVCLVCRKRLPGSKRYCKSCDPTGSDKECMVCGKKFKHVKNGQNSHTKCNSCMANAHKDSKKLKAVEYKGGCCQICGYIKNVKALHFHHLDPSKKDFGISGNHTRKWEVIQAELDKCILVCSNCHMEIHEGLIDLTGVEK